MSGVLLFLGLVLILGSAAFFLQSRDNKAKRLRRDNAALLEAIGRVQMLCIDHLESEPFATVVLDETRTSLKEITR